MHFKYKFTLFTPCYNSSKFFDRIKETLDKQTYRNFEWIVINDASTDNTSDLIKDYIKTVDFPVKFFDLEHNQMLAANYNLAFNNAEGELFVILGHDDIYMPDMLEHLYNLYRKYDGPTIGGLVGRCETQYGKITPSEFAKPVMNFFEYGFDKKGNGTGEAPRVLKTEVMAHYMPFNPEEKLNPTIEALMGRDGYSFITTNKIIRKYFVNENENALTLNIKKYPLYNWKNTLMVINVYQKRVQFSFKKRVYYALMYSYATVRLKKSFIEAYNSLEHDRLLFMILYPLGYLVKLVADNKLLHDWIIQRQFKK